MRRNPLDEQGAGVPAFGVEPVLLSAAIQSASEPMARSGPSDRGDNIGEVFELFVGAFQFVNHARLLRFQPACVRVMFRKVSRVDSIDGFPSIRRARMSCGAAADPGNSCCNSKA